MAQIGTIRLQGPTDAYDVPVFEPVNADERTALRVQTSSGPGCIALADPAIAAYPQLRVETPNGIRAVHKYPTFTPANTVVADFESDLEAFSGDRSQTTRSPERAWRGSWSLLVDSVASRFFVYAFPAGGNEWFLPQGYEWIYRFNSPDSGSFPFIDHLFGLRTEIDDPYYAVRVNTASDDIQIRQSSSGTGNSSRISPKADSSENLVDDAWYQVVVRWYPNGTIETTLFDGQANQLAQTSATGSLSGVLSMGFGWYAYKMSAYIDAVEVTDVL
jgi:hypothetical protein